MTLIVGFASRQHSETTSDVSEGQYAAMASIDSPVRLSQKATLMSTSQGHLTATALIASSVSLSQALQPRSVSDGQFAAMALIPREVTFQQPQTSSTVSEGQFAAMTVIDPSVTCRHNHSLISTSGAGSCWVKRCNRTLWMKAFDILGIVLSSASTSSRSEKSTSSPSGETKTDRWSPRKERHVDARSAASTNLRCSRKWAASQIHLRARRLAVGLGRRREEGTSSTMDISYQVVSQPAGPKTRFSDRNDLKRRCRRAARPT